MSICGEPEEGTQRVCDKARPCYFQHETDGEGWGTSAVPSSGSKRKTIDSMAGAIRPERPVGAPDTSNIDWKTGMVAVLGSHGQAEEISFPDAEAWQAYALEVFRGFLLERAQTFTTPEDVWPLLRACPEKRSFSQVVRTALSKQWIVEVGARRLNDTYHSADGIEFKMNKLVPVYMSRLITVKVSTGPVDLSDVDLVD